ncbi:fumarylacetoacetate hydrolase family protein [Pseudanabaena sp. FACHB-1998]|uniref:fumarylacetoacetate hydrolase family protein n=1 Tax=Pseudanabaena sp. FACHB-1998 TaxID=2692858 RepID=UPI0016810644|nr:fumarylacetoacetate hydrolase family protein [Pseudanabaena sp. FACHB-1998]MBD2177110.1 fumarylacetoacetate hydrolase family protein [Pseudanabaena sp. FACHB-1998]
MADRYVRVKDSQDKVSYGLLELNQSVKLLSGAPWLGGEPNGELLAPDTYQLLAPCEPSKIVAVGKNYSAHAVEMGGEVPKEPILFLKPTTTIIAPEAEIALPPQSKRVEYEGELALVIGTKCFNLTPKKAIAAIWGYTIANDVTARDIQRSDSQWTRGKGFDTFCPLGPWIVREISPSAMLQTFMNDVKKPLQSAAIDEMVFSPDYLVSYISQIMTLLPGDIILTGTPEGVGPMQEGDRVCVGIEGIGKLQNTVILRAALPAIEELDAADIEDSDQELIH